MTTDEAYDLIFNTVCDGLLHSERENLFTMWVLRNAHARKIDPLIVECKELLKSRS